METVLFVKPCLLSNATEPEARGAMQHQGLKKVACVHSTVVAILLLYGPIT